MKLIDADKLENIISDTWILDRIDEQPTVDPIKHGHWIIDKDRRWHCSECYSVAPKGYRYPYCPYCGARMSDNRETIVPNGEQIDELVRCKDCIWWDNHDGGERCLNPVVYLSWAKPNSFCPYGERVGGEK